MSPALTLLSAGLSIKALERYEFAALALTLQVAKGVDIEEAAIGELEVRDHRQGQEREGQERLLRRRSPGAGCGDDPIEAR